MCVYQERFLKEDVTEMDGLPASRFFPPIEMANEDGLIGVGGKMSVEWLVDAYAHGIFPWPVHERDTPMLWWSPDPRAILPIEKFHVPRRLRRTCRSNRFRVTFDRDFPAVIRACSAGPGRQGCTWITPRMIKAYEALHQAGKAHSVDVWFEGRLAGGLYGVAIGGLFAAESMFYTVRDASKVGLVSLVEHLQQKGYTLIDIQQFSSHLAQFGAVEVERDEYLRQLTNAVCLPINFS